MEFIGVFIEEGIIEAGNGNKYYIPRELIKEKLNSFVNKDVVLEHGETLIGYNLIGTVKNAFLNIEGYTTSQGEKIEQNEKFYIVSEVNNTFDELKKIIEDTYTQLQSKTESGIATSKEIAQFEYIQETINHIQKDFAYSVEIIIRKSDEPTEINGIEDVRLAHDIELINISLTLNPRYFATKPIIKNSSNKKNSAEILIVGGEMNKKLDNNILASNTKINMELNEENIATSIFEKLKNYFTSNEKSSQENKTVEASDIENDKMAEEIKGEEEVKASDIENNNNDIVQSLVSRMEELEKKIETILASQTEEQNNQKSVQAESEKNMNELKASASRKINEVNMQFSDSNTPLDVDTMNEKAKNKIKKQ